MVDVKKTISKAAAAKRVGVSRPTILRAIAAGELRPVVDAAGDERLNVNHVDMWAERRTGRKAKKSDGDT